MSDQRDIVKVEGFGAQRGEDSEASARAEPRRPFLSIWFRCCHVYARIYRNSDETAYEGRCPRCGARVSALIGADGTNKRMFEAR